MTAFINNAKAESHQDHYHHEGRLPRKVRRGGVELWRVCVVGTGAAAYCVHQSCTMRSAICPPPLHVGTAEGLTSSRSSSISSEVIGYTGIMINYRIRTTATLRAVQLAIVSFPTIASIPVTDISTAMLGRDLTGRCEAPLLIHSLYYHWYSGNHFCHGWAAWQLPCMTQHGGH